MHLGPRLMQGVSSRAKGRLARMHILAYKFLDLHRCPRIRRTQGSKIKTTCPIRHFPYSHTVQTPRETPPAHNPTHTYHGTSLPLPTQSPSLPTTSSHKPSSHRSHPFPVPRSLRAKLKPVERPCKPRLLRLNSEGCRAHALFAHHESRFTVPTHSSRYKVYVPARAKHVSFSYSADAGAQYRTCRWLLERAQEAASS